MENGSDIVRDKYSKTQEKIRDLMENKKTKNKCGGKYLGDVCCRIFRNFLLKEIPQKYTISSPNAYIVGFPTEFDLLIVDKGAKPEKYSNAFQPEKVKCGLEIKAHGIIAKKEDLRKRIRNLKQTFDKIRKCYPSIKFIYLTYEEAVRTEKKSSIQYWKITRETLKPYKAFCLRNSRLKKRLIPREWKRLVSYLKKNLK